MVSKRGTCTIREKNTKTTFMKSSQENLIPQEISSKAANLW